MRSFWSSADPKGERLATALTANDGLVAAGLPPLTLLAADRELLAAALAEGLPTDNPNLHP